MLKRLQYIFLSVIVFTLINIVPHIIVRIFADANAVRVFETSAVPEDFKGTIKIATYNIAHGRGGKYGSENWTDESVADRESRLVSIANFLKENDVDVVALNEVDFDASWSYNLNQSEFIARHANFPFRVEQRNFDFYHPFFRLQFGNAVLSKYPISAVSFLEFSPLSKLEKLVFGNHDGVVVSLRLSEDREISVAGLHLEVRDSSSRLSAYGILEDLIANENFPTILAGDLNSEMHDSGEGGSVIDRLSKIEGIEYFPDTAVTDKYYTFPSEKPSRTLDWILVPPNVGIVGGEVPDVSWSDHLPVIVEIKMYRPR